MNPNSRMIIGNTGSGKTFFLQKKLNSLLERSEDFAVYVLGSKKEYDTILQTHNGVDVSEKEFNCIPKERFVLFNTCGYEFSETSNLADLFTALQEQAEYNKLNHKQTYIFVDDVDKYIGNNNNTVSSLEKMVFSRDNFTTLTAQDIPSGLELVSLESEEVILFPSSFESYNQKMSEQLGFNLKKAKELSALSSQNQKQGTILSLTKSSTDGEFVPHLYGFETT